MKHRSGESLPAKIQTTVENNQSRRDGSPTSGGVAVLALAAVLAGGPHHTGDRIGTPQESAQTVASQEARVLASEINDIYTNGPSSYQRVQQSPDGRGWVRQLSARYRLGSEVNEDLYVMQVKGLGDGEKQGSPLTDVTVTQIPAGHTVQAPSYSLSIHFGENGISSITMLDADPQYPATQQITFDGSEAVNQNGQAIDAGEVTDVFNMAHSKVLNLKP